MPEVTLIIDPKVMVVGKKLVDMLEVFGRLDLDAEGLASGLADTINRGLLSKDVRPTLSNEERAERTEHEAAREEIRQDLTTWLRSNPGPSYNGDRQNARSIDEIITMARLPRKPGVNQIVKNVLESETTGWGLVGLVDSVRLYGKKAALITFRTAA
jgi:hypothetical protein